MTFLCLVIRKRPLAGLTACAVFEAAGLKPYFVDSLASAMLLMRQWNFDLLVVEPDGFESSMPAMLGQLRSAHLPLVVVARDAGEDAQLHWIEQGATDVIGHLLSPRLIGLRLCKLAEIGKEKPEEIAPQICLGSLLMDTRRATAVVRTTPLNLTARQFDLLLLLVSRAGVFVRRETIAAALRCKGGASSRSIDMLVSRIRGKLRTAGDDRLALHTVYGRGYALTYERDAVAGQPLPAELAAA